MDSDRRGHPSADPGSSVAGHDPREGVRLQVVEQYVREQFEDDLRALTEAEQDSKALKSAKRQLALRPHHRVRRAAVPGGPATVDGDAPVVKDALTAVRQEGGRGDLQAARAAEDRRQAPPGRPRRGGHPPVTRSASWLRARTAPALFQRGQTQIMSLLTLGTAKEGQRIDDLSLESDRRFMHHYNFRALLGRRDRVHARAEAPRHRPRCASHSGRSSR